MSTTERPELVSSGAGLASSRRCGVGRRARHGRRRSRARLLGGRLPPLPPRQVRDRGRGLHLRPALLVAFIGAPIAAHLLGHGPNDLYSGGVDANTLLPVGPLDARVQPAVPGARPAHFDHTFFILGADSQLGRDEFLRLIYGAQTSLEVAVGATLFAMIIGVADGRDRRLLRRRDRHGHQPDHRDRDGLPGAAVRHRPREHRRRAARQRSRSGSSAPGVVTLIFVLGSLRLVLPGPHRPSPGALVTREGVRRGRPDDRHERLEDHPLAHPAAPGRADHRLLDAGRRVEHPRRGRSLVPRPRDQGSRRRAGATCSRPHRTTT